jgi:hypothetical protein
MFSGDSGFGGMMSRSEDFFIGSQDTPFVPGKAIRTTSEDQSVILNNLINFLNAGMMGMDPGIGAFTGEMPGATGLQSASLSGLERLAAGDTNVFSDPTTLAGLDAIQGILSGGPQDFMDYFESGVADPAQRDLERAIDEIDASMVGSGNLFGGDRRGAVRDTTEDFFRNMGEQRSRYGLETLNADMEAKLGALGLLPSITNIDIDRGSRLFDIGERERNIGVSQFEADQAEANRQEQVRQFILDLIFRSGTSPTFGITGGFPLQPASDGGAIGGFLGGFSSKALKIEGHDVISEEVLERLQSLPIKAWQYIWEHGEDGFHVGPYAEDFQKAFGGDWYKVDFLHMLGVSMVALQEVTSRLEGIEARLTAIEEV